jgi:hypothetical protein
LGEKFSNASGASRRGIAKAVSLIAMLFENRISSRHHPVIGLAEVRLGAQRPSKRDSEK